MSSTVVSTRVSGAVLIASSVAILVLFLLHPAEHATDFPGFIREQAAQRVMDTVVHGGFVVILGIQVACYAIFSARLGWHRSAVTTGIAFFTLGTISLAAAISVDGVLTPALAARLVDTPPDQLAASHTIFRLLGVAIEWFRLLGLGFQGAGIGAWGIALLPRTRAAAIGALAIALLMLAALATAVAIQPGIAILAIFGLLLWSALAGLLLWRTPA